MGVTIKQLKKWKIPLTLKLLFLISFTKLMLIYSKCKPLSHGQKIKLPKVEENYVLLLFTFIEKNGSVDVSTVWGVSGGGGGGGEGGPHPRLQTLEGGLGVAVLMVLEKTSSLGNCIINIFVAVHA